MSDPFVEGTRQVLEESLDEIRRGVADLTVVELNSRPAGGTTNSIAVIVSHALGATLSWLCLGFGAPLPARDRDAEFRAVADDGFVAWTESAIARCLAVLDDTTWDPARTGTPNWGSRYGNVPQSAPYCVGHALAHLGEHVGHLHMTRDLLRPSA